MTVDQQMVVQIAAGSPAAARVLAGHGIDSRAGGERTLAEACADLGLDLAAITAELQAANEDTHDRRDWTTEPLADLIAFLKQDHEVVRQELRALGERINRLASQPGALKPGMEHLPRVFSRLAEDLDSHMAHEEAEVFPAVTRYLDAAREGLPIKGSPLSAFGGPLRMMESEHDSNGTALRLMREFAHDYQIPEDSCADYRTLIEGMTALEDRLLRHIYLENNVLFPRAAALKPGRVPALS